MINMDNIVRVMHDYMSMDANLRGLKYQKHVHMTYQCRVVYIQNGAFIK